METQPVTSPYPIAEFLQWKESGQLDIRPWFQRRDVWIPKAQSYLIDTILRQMPIPAIYIRLRVDPKTFKPMRQVVDGQQRISTVFKFIKGDFTIHKVHNSELAGLTFSELPPEIQQKFMQYKLSVNTLEGVSDEDVLRIFARINTYTVPLNKQELRNAEYFGAFKSCVYEISIRHLAFWRNNNIFRDKDIARMLDAEFTSELIVTMMSGFKQTKDKDLRYFYKEYDDEFRQGEELSKQFDKTIDTIGMIFGNELVNLPFRRVPLFFSLFICIYGCLYGIPNETTPKISFSEGNREAIFNSLKKLGQIITASDAPQQYADLIEASRRGTADVAKRRLRHGYICRFLKNAIS